MNPSAPKSAAAFARTYLLDAGPLIAALDRNDRHHSWAKELLLKTSGRFSTCEACLAETLHGVENAPQAIASLRVILSRMDVVPVASFNSEGLFELLAQFSPAMDLADGCLATLQRSMRGSIVVTTEDRDFSTYRVPYLSPRGVFAR
jgi:predicted nucleic acid-binding protein